MTLHVAPSVVIRKVVETSGMIGILPELQDGEAEPWWLPLAAEGRSSNMPRIIWRLPFFASPSGRFEDLGAMAVACMLPEPTGDDVTVAVFVCDPDVSRARLLEAMQAIGLTAQVITTHEEDDRKGRLLLVLIDEFVDENDPRLETLIESMNEMMFRSVILGAYPKPLVQPAGGRESGA